MSSTTYYAAELMVYFEKHRFFEILRVLLVRISLDRPVCVKHYLRRNLRKIANSVLAIIHVPKEFDVDKFVCNCLKMYNIPIISYNTKGVPFDEKHLEVILHKFEKFCKLNGIERKNKIFLNFPKNFSQFLTLRNCNSPPIVLINVAKNKSHNQDIEEVYCPQMNVCCTEGDTEEDVLPEIMYKLKYAPNTEPYDFSQKFLYRVIILGRRGSGATTQAKLLAAKFDLIFINIESLITQTLQTNDYMSRVMCISYKKTKKFSSSSIIALVWKRLLQKDALSHGWVITGFPKCVNEMMTFVESFQTPPNIVVVVHCSKNLALRRLIKKWENSGLPISTNMNTTTYVEKEHSLYDEHKNTIYSYLKRCGVKTIHVDGSHKISTVRNKMFALLQR